MKRSNGNMKKPTFNKLQKAMGLVDTDHPKYDEDSEAARRKLFAIRSADAALKKQQKWDAEHVCSACNYITKSNGACGTAGCLYEHKLPPYRQVAVATSVAIAASKDVATKVAARRAARVAAKAGDVEASLEYILGCD
jgi:hypothetical protein